MRLARQIANGVLVAGLLAIVAWVAVSHGPRWCAYARGLLLLRQAEQALACGDRVEGLRRLGRAGRAGDARLGRLLAGCHNQADWAGLVADLQEAYPEIAGPLHRALSRSAEERLCAAEALAALGDERGIEALAQALTEPDALAHSPSELAGLGLPGVEALGHVARSGIPQARERALGLLGDADFPEATRLLMRLADDAGYAQRNLALRALMGRGDAPLARLLTDALQAADVTLRVEALRQFAAQSGPEAVPRLAEALDDRHSEVRAAAAEALGTIDDTEAGRLLVRALRDPSLTVARHAVYGLGRRHDEWAQRTLAEAYAEAPASLQEDIVTALCWMESPLAPEYKARWEAETGQQLVVSSAWDG